MDPNSPYPPNSPGGPGYNPGYQPPAPSPGQSYGPSAGQPYGAPNQANGPIVQPLQPNPYSNYGQPPYPTQSPRPSRRRGPGKTVFVIIVVAVVVLVGMATLIAMTSSGGGNEPTDTPTDQKTATTGSLEDVVPRNDGQLDLESKLDTSQSVKEQTVKAKEKEQVNLSSGFSFMASKVEAYTSANPAVKPAEGKKFVSVSIVVGNRAQSNTISVSYLDFKLRDVDGNVLVSHASTQEILSNTLANPTALKPGEQINGKVVFEVDANDNGWVLIHKENYQKTTDNTTFSVEGDISIGLPTAGTTTPPATTTPPTTTPPTSST